MSNHPPITIPSTDPNLRILVHTDVLCTVEKCDTDSLGNRQWLAVENNKDDNFEPQIILDLIAYGTPSALRFRTAIQLGNIFQTHDDKHKLQTYRCILVQPDSGKSVDLVVEMQAADQRGEIRWDRHITMYLKDINGVVRSSRYDVDYLLLAYWQ